MLRFLIVSNCKTEKRGEEERGTYLQVSQERNKIDDKRLESHEVDVLDSAQHHSNKTRVPSVNSLSPGRAFWPEPHPIPHIDKAARQHGNDSLNILEGPSA